MKTTLLIAACLATVATAVGCGGRSPEMYRDDTTKVLGTKQDAIKACYDDVLKGSPSVGGKVTVNFEIETEGGKIQNVSIDKPNTTAPDALGDCVTKSIEGLVLTPPDHKVGQATYVYEFTIPPTPAAPPAAAPVNPAPGS